MAPSSSNISLHFRDSRPGGSLGKVKYVGGPSAGLHTRRESEWAQGENGRLQAWLEKRATSCFHLCRPVLWGLLTGAPITETVFNWPGVGRLFVDAINTLDFPVIQGVVVIITLMTLVANVITDISYAFIDPRIRID